MSPVVVATSIFLMHSPPSYYPSRPLPGESLHDVLVLQTCNLVLSGSYI